MHLKVFSQVNLQLQRESLVKKQREDPIQPLPSGLLFDNVFFLILTFILSLSGLCFNKNSPLYSSSAKSNRAKTSPRKRSCCQIITDAIVAFIQVFSFTHLYFFVPEFFVTFFAFQGIFYCIIFPALVMVGPAGLLYMLYECYVENDVSRALI